MTDQVCACELLSEPESCTTLERENERSDEDISISSHSVLRNYSMYTEVTGFHDGCSLPHRPGWTTVSPYLHNPLAVTC